jgi:hypothetical protein
VSARAADTPVVVLRTDYASFREIEGTVPGRILRELARQALLIAARDELGAFTRDDTLGETERLGDLKATVDWLPRVRTRWKGVTEIRLEQAAGGSAVGEPIVAHDGNIGITTAFPVLAESWEVASRTELKERLAEQGVQGQVPPLNADNQPDEEVEALLQRMNFVSQWEAVSRAHRAIAEKGPSVEWIAVLSRGYAHLGTLTDHHWNGAPEAFYARAMLYAERARRFNGGDAAAVWLRPYVLAMCGAHAAALEQLAPLGDDPARLPAWARVIDPVSRFDIEALEQLAKKEPSVRPLALWSIVCLKRTLGAHGSFHKVAMASLESDPDAYGVYSAMVNLNYALGDQRFGASRGPMALRQVLLKRLAEVQQVPESLRDDLPENGAELRRLVEKLKDNYEGDPFLPTPNLVIDELRKADAKADSPREPSWGSLAALIAEEQFIMAASYGANLQNATESDLTAPADALSRLVEGHRYAPFIKSYALPRSAPPQRLAELIGGLAIRDARHNMRPLIWKATQLPAPEGKYNLGYDTSWQALWGYDYRLPSLAEESIHGIPLWWKHLKEHNRKHVVVAYRETSPHAPQWLRCEMDQTTDPSAEQLEAWSELAKKDYVTSLSMATFYDMAQQFDQALEWLKRSYELEPSGDTAMRLARLYRATDQKELWLPTLTRYFGEVENRGLEHSQVQIYIAETLMREDRDFVAALPYAEAAAQTYSAQALMVAIEANEGLARWEEADGYARALATSYPTHSGEKWYLFRRRTGHGDPEEMRPYLEASYAVAGGDQKAWNKACYPYYESRIEEAIESFHQEGVRTSNVYWYVMAAIAATESGDKERAAKEIATAKEIAATLEEEADKPLAGVVDLCAELLQTGRSLAEPDAIREQLAAINPALRRHCQLFIGAATQVLGVESDLSDELLYEAAATPPFDELSGNLAGHLLVRKYGQARTDPVDPLNDNEAE